MQENDKFVKNAKVAEQGYLKDLGLLNDEIERLKRRLGKE